MRDGAEAARSAGAGVTPASFLRTQEPQRERPALIAKPRDSSIAQKWPISRVATPAGGYGSLRSQDDRTYAVTASRSSSSSSSSIGLKVESGLVDSVIGLRPLLDED